MRHATPLRSSRPRAISAAARPRPALVAALAALAVAAAAGEARAVTYTLTAHGVYDPPSINTLGTSQDVTHTTHDGSPASVVVGYDTADGDIATGFAAVDASGAIGASTSWQYPQAFTTFDDARIAADAAWRGTFQNDLGAGADLALTFTFAGGELGIGQYVGTHHRLTAEAALEIVLIRGGGEQALLLASTVLEATSDGTVVNPDPPFNHYDLADGIGAYLRASSDGLEDSSYEETLAQARLSIPSFTRTIALGSFGAGETFSIEYRMRSSIAFDRADDINPDGSGARAFVSVGDPFSVGGEGGEARISIGQAAPAAVPEPSSLALAALGAAAGVRALRRSGAPRG